jgi:hypothetical protein
MARIRYVRCDKKGHAAVRVASYNVNGVNGRLPSLLAWLDEGAPDSLKKER